MQTATTTHADHLAAELTRTGQELRHIVRVPAQRKGD